ncbi:hypothetical protein HZB03_04235 [Candidatus Woesearchaeota archaeon]|nr:hypothetical protein [Candidatus Woesearchaeota archaeon]
MQEEIDFFEKINEIAEKRKMLHERNLGGNELEQKICNEACILWAFATDDDILTTVARLHMEQGIQTTVEELREARRTHQLHLALGKKH